MRYPFTHFAAFAFFWLTFSAAHSLIVSDLLPLIEGMKDMFPLAGGFWSYHVFSTVRPRPGSEGGAG